MLAGAGAQLMTSVFLPGAPVTSSLPNPETNPETSAGQPVITRAGTGLTIVPTFDTTITTDPNAATIEAAINNVIAFYHAAYTDPITVNITFKSMTSGLGMSQFFIIPTDYSAVRAALVTNATTSNDAIALAHLPAGNLDPVQQHQTILMKGPNLSALGLAGATADGGTISLNTSLCNLDRNAALDPNKYDIQAVTAHEIDEILGMGSGAGDAPNTDAWLQDMYRYDANGNRSFTASASAVSFFSIDGVTKLVGFEQNGGGDFGDWISDGGPNDPSPHTPRVQDAFGTPGIILNPGLVELENLDVQGYHLAFAPTDISLSNNTVLEHSPVGTPVGLLTTTEAGSTTHSYSLVSGTGSTDNASFSIDGSGQLLTNAVFDFNTKNTYSIRVRTTDANSNTFEKVFTINVLQRQATTLVVDILGDTPQFGHTTLREAVNKASSDFVGDTITFANGLTGVITLTNGELDATAPMTIIGPGSGVLTVSGNNNSRIFNVDDNNPGTSNAVSITGLTLTAGNESSGLGGGLANAETLTLSNDVFLSNTASASGGAVWNNGTLNSSNNAFTSNQSSGGAGGAVWTQGTFISSNDTFLNNTAAFDGGALVNWGTMSTSNDTIANNVGTSAVGGVENWANYTSNGDTFSGNSGGQSGGAIVNASNGILIATNDTIFGNSAGTAGGVSNFGILTTVNVTITNNTATSSLAGGVQTSNGTWNALNTIIAGNVLTSGSTTPSDIVVMSGTVNVRNSLVGDSSSAGGLTDGTNGNRVGRPVNQIFKTDINGIPVLANNGGPTKSVALIKGSVANGGGAALAQLSSSITAATTSLSVSDSTFIGVGDLLSLNLEFVLVTGINGNTLTVLRGQAGTVAASHSTNTPANLAVDQTGALRGNLDMGSLIGTENHAPQGFGGQVNILEDSTYTLKLSDFNFSDANDNPANNFLSVKITTLPLKGTLKDNGTLVTAGQFVSVADIAGNKLIYSPAPNGNGSGYGNFTFQVRDDGGTSGGGVDLDPSPKTMVINVISVNDAPVGTSGTVTATEDTAYVFKTTDFGFTDPNDSPANLLYAVKINSLPANGTLTNKGVAVTVGQVVNCSDILGSKFIFTPAANANGSPYANFNFQVQDDNGTANGGKDLDPNPKTLTINVASVNDAPSGAAKTVSLFEDTAYTFKTSDFGFSDSNDNPANSLLAVKIASLPAKGSLKDNGVPVSLGQAVSVADIVANQLVFTPAANGNNGVGSSYASFTFQVQDDGGTANGGKDTDPTPKTMTVSVINVNDAPAGASRIVTTLEDIAYVIKTTDFGFSDTHDSPANSLLAVTITALPSKGTLTDNGAAVTLGQVVSATDIANNKLVFTPAPNASGANYASLKFQVQDNGGTANGGVDTDPTAKTLTFNVTSVNDAPSGTAATIVAAVNQNYVFKVADFGMTDVNDTPANSLAAVKFTLLPSAGVLKDNGTPLTVGQSVSVSDITNGRLTFTPNTNLAGGPFFLAKFQVQDDGGTANGGKDLDPTAKVLNVKLIKPNHAPSGTNGTVSAVANTPYVFKLTDFGFTDANDSPANSLLAVKFTLLPTAGTLTDNGVAVTVNQFVSAADINSGKLIFTPKQNLTGGPFFLCKFQVQDNGGTDAGGVNLDPTAKVLNVRIS